MKRLRVLFLLVLLLFIGTEVYSRVYNGLLLIPSGVDAVFSLRVNKFKLNQLRKSSSISEKISEFARDYGISIDDIKRVYGAFYGDSGEDLLIVGEGIFKSSVSYSSILSLRGGEVVLREYLGIKYVSGTLDGKSFAILDNRLVIFGLESRLKLAIGLFLGRSRDSIRRDKGVYNFLLKLPSGSILRVVSALPKFMLNMSGSEQAGAVQHLKYINMLVIDYTYIGGRDNFEFKGFCSSKREALLAESGMREFVGMQLPFLSMLLSNQSPILLEVIQRGKFYTRGRVAVSKWSLTRGEFESIVGGVEIDKKGSPSSR